MSITFSEHAVQQMDARGISREAVQEAVKRSLLTRGSNGRFIANYGSLYVVFEPAVSGWFMVVTAYRVA